MAFLVALLVLGWILKRIARELACNIGDYAYSEVVESKSPFIVTIEEVASKVINQHLIHLWRKERATLTAPVMQLLLFNVTQRLREMPQWTCFII